MFCWIREFMLFSIDLVMRIICKEAHQWMES